jgi:multicomponent Na+:H+ antiporter subunit C
MSLALWYALTGIALLAVGLHGLIVRVHALRQILAVNIMGAGVFLVLVASAHRRPPGSIDPVPHAMVLTGVVVAICATAVALALARRLHGASGTREDASDDEHGTGL